MTTTLRNSPRTWCATRAALFAVVASVTAFGLGAMSSPPIRMPALPWPPSSMALALAVAVVSGLIGLGTAMYESTRRTQLVATIAFAIALASFVIAILAGRAGVA